ncbi:MAG: hypothetical protein SNH88_03455 [Rikenellaceae bacterium]
MKLYLLLLSCALALPLSASAGSKYPTQGVVAQFSFDTDGLSSVGDYYFVDGYIPAERAATLQEKKADLNRFLVDGAFASNYYAGPTHIEIMPKDLLFCQPQVTFLVRLKLAEKFAHSTLFMSGTTKYHCKIAGGAPTDNCKVVYSCAINKEADKRYFKDYRIDLGIKRGEWTTLIVSFDATKSEVRFTANGRTETLYDPGINEKYKNSSKEINQYLRFDVNKGDIEDDKDPALMSYVDDVVIYNRILTDDELIAIAGVDGKLVTVKTPTEKPRMVIIWQITLFQMVCAVLIVLLIFYTSAKRLWHTSVSERGDDVKAYEHLKNAFSYWGFDADAMGGLPLSYDELSYPEKRKYLNRSLKEYRKALSAGAQDEKIVEAMNLFADVHNSATRFIFDCKWWVFAAPVFAVYFKEMLANFLAGIGLDMTMSSYVNLPEGVIDQFLYFSHYYLPTVLFSAIVVYVSCYTQRFHNVKGTCIVDSDFTSQSIKDRYLRPAGWILVGMAPGLGMIPLALTLVGIFFAVKAGGSIETTRVTTVYSDGSRSSEDQGDFSGAAVMIFLAAAIFLAMWLAAAFVIYLFHVVFIFYVFRNHVIRKFW